MDKRKILIPGIAIFVIVLLFVFYNEGLLFKTNGDTSMDTSEQVIDTIKQGEVPLGDPPLDKSGSTSDTIKQGSNTKGVTPDGTVDPKTKQEVKEKGNNVVPLGDPPKDETNNNSTQQGGNETPAEEDKAK